MFDILEIKIILAQGLIINQDSMYIEAPEICSLPVSFINSNYIIF